MYFFVIVLFALDYSLRMIIWKHEEYEINLIPVIALQELDWSSSLKSDSAVAVSNLEHLLPTHESQKGNLNIHSFW